MNAGSPNNEEAMTPAPDASEAPFLQVLAHRSMLKAYLLVIVRDPHLAADGFRAGATFAGRAAQGGCQLAAVLHVWPRGQGALNLNVEVGRDGALRRPRRRAQRQATERMATRALPCTFCSARSAWA
jgi:hypothetical protein